MTCDVTIRVSPQIVTLRQSDQRIILRTLPQGPPGPVGGSFTIQAGETVAAGQPVYVSTLTAEVFLARADAVGTAHVLGLAATSAAIGFTTEVLAIGSVTLTDWTAVTGSATLTRGMDYFLSSATAGMITTTAPQSSGDWVTRVGHAVSTTTLEIHVHRPIGKV